MQTTIAKVANAWRAIVRLANSKGAVVNGSFCSGMALLAVGLWLISPAWALVVIGFILLTGAVVGALR